MGVAIACARRRVPVRRVSSQATSETSPQDAQGPQGEVLEVAEGGRDDEEGAGAGSGRSGI